MKGDPTDLIGSAAIWSAASSIEQIEAWPAVPENGKGAFIANSRPAAKIIFLGIANLELQGDNPGDGLILRKMLQDAYQVYQVGGDTEIFRISNDIDLLARFVCRELEQKRSRFNWEQGLDQDILDEWPAAELIPTSGKLPEGSVLRWGKSGGKTYGGRLIALKKDPVWARFNIFGKPYPPYESESRLMVMDVTRDDAEQLGIAEHIGRATIHRSPSKRPKKAAQKNNPAGCGTVLIVAFSVLIIVLFSSLTLR